MIEVIRQRVLPHYGLEGNAAKVSALGNGHINDTFLVTWDEGSMVLQRLNTSVFPTPWTLVENAELISRHLGEKEGKDYGLKVVTPKTTAEGELGIDLGEVGFWRAIRYLKHSSSIDVVGSEAQAEQAARAFGHFARALCDFDATQIGDVIPKFHFLPGRLAALEQAVADDKAGRLATCREWVDFALGQRSLLDELAALEPKLPLRVCHNDTKINNMLFDKRDDSAMAIIDLDTCMKGHLMYDFGDMVRTFTSPEAEDSKALDKVRVRPEIFAAICRGYLAELGDVLESAERESLWLGARIMCLMIGVRFITDYLNGDLYFHVHREGHNLDRAANQFTLYQSLLTQADRLKACIF
ncbi:phosphotransferase enzyme family protein [Shewanella sp. FJAT-52076]|uniref:phosphotransferase enzyme family protein n=1 Tax=Shewanella sp. FJAT-52076 TaxID=2864202 RepID=UPI001C65913B|nr:aminoglycoside phosphotransferase family protein [Shewanella sp. FJAT-52076]QYJ75683.1 aminoglycoside phosphotransferase family protein [Shewanella sp. FJAT-52076]